jgi:tRNA acetyltransferase TAN1
MISEFNIIATTDRITESRACNELWSLLHSIGDIAPIVDKTEIWGVICAKTNLDPVNAIQKIRVKIEETRNYPKFLYRILPIQKVVDTDLTKIANKVKNLYLIIPEDKTFRITAEKRKTKLHSLDIIKEVAKYIDRKVDLEDPDWIVLIEIIGRFTGISVITTDKILNIQKERFSLS